MELLVGGTAAMLAAGIAATTGDAGKAMTMMGAAGMAGASFTNYYGDKLTKAGGKALDAARVGFWGSDYKQVQQAKFDKAMMQSPELMAALTQALGYEGAKKAIDDKSVQAILNNNITDPGKIAKTLGLQKQLMDPTSTYYRKDFDKDPDKALQHAIAVGMWNRDVNPGIYNTNSSEYNSFRRGLIESGLSDSDVQKIINELNYYES